MLLPSHVSFSVLDKLFRVIAFSHLDFSHTTIWHISLIEIFLRMTSLVNDAAMDFFHASFFLHAFKWKNCKYKLKMIIWMSSIQWLCFDGHLKWLKLLDLSNVGIKQEIVFQLPHIPSPNVLPQDSWIDVKLPRKLDVDLFYNKAE